MRRALMPLLLTALLCPLAHADKPASPADGNADFAWSLYRQLATQKGNLFLSPHSISTALAMTSAGAKGETDQEMMQALHLQPPAQRHAGFGALARTLQTRNTKSVELRAANRLFAQRGFAIGPHFADTVKAHYGADVGLVDYKDQTEQARRTINDWVAGQTKNRIKDLLPSGVLTPLTRLVLTNAVYFKGTWDSPFDPKSTRDQAFFVAPDQSVRVPMMSQTGRFRFARVAGGVEVCELPYKGDQLSMVVLLPPAGGMAKLEQSLTARAVRGWIAQSQAMRVNVRLPRFKFTKLLRLKAPLKTLGMRKAFEAGAADLSGIALPPGELFITAVVHKAFVEVNEIGTEAAAATGVVAGIKSMPEQFVANRPFLFVIRDRPTGAILFVGRLVDPS